jgi:hypothetical protein
MAGAFFATALALPFAGAHHAWSLVPLFIGWLLVLYSGER